MRRRNCRGLGIIILFVIFSISIVSSQNISVDYKEEIEINQEFNFKLSLVDFPQDVYDVKIDMLVNGERVAQILNNNEWKSTYYYINDILNSGEEKMFKLKASKSGNADIEIKIRNSKDKSVSFSGYSIKFIPSPEEDEEETEESSNQEENNSQNKNEENSANEKEEVNNSQIPVTGDFVSKNLEIIKLNDINSSSKDIKSERNSLISRDKLGIISLIVFTIIIGVLVYIQNKKEKRNEIE